MQLPRTLFIKLDKETKKLLQEHAKSRDQYKEMVEKILQQKQVEINNQIDKLNRQHLLVLQKKVLALQKKDQQILKINNTLTILRNQLSDVNNQNANLIDENRDHNIKSIFYQKNIKELQSSLKDNKNRYEQLKKQMDNKQSQINVLSQKYDKLNRDFLKYKQDMFALQQRSNSIMKNQQQVITQQFQQKIQSIIVQEKAKIMNLETKLKHQKKKNQNLQTQLKQQKFNVENFNIQIQTLKKSIKPVPIVLTNSTQTQYKKQKQFLSFGVNVNNKCSQCINFIKQLQSIKQRQKQKQRLRQIQKQNHNFIIPLSNYIVKKQIQFVKTNEVQSKECANQFSQTQPQIKHEKVNNKTQTNNKMVVIDQIIQFMQIYQDITKILKTKLELEKQKYTELQEIFMSRPMRNQDKSIINKSQFQKMEIKLLMLQSQEENNKLRLTIESLNKSIQQLKFLNLNSMIIKSPNKQVNKKSTLKIIDSNQKSNIKQTIRISRLSKTFSILRNQNKSRLITQRNQSKEFNTLLNDQFKKIQSGYHSSNSKKFGYKKYSFTRRKKSQEKKLKIVFNDFF